MTCPLDDGVVELLTRAAERQGVSASAFVARAVRHEALRVGAGIEPLTAAELEQEAADAWDDMHDDAGGSGFRAAG